MEVAPLSPRRAQENDDEGEEGEDAEEEEEKECDPEVAPPPEDKQPAPKCTAAKSLATPETLKKRKQAPEASEKKDRLRRLQSKVRRAQQGSPAIPLTEHAKTRPSPMGFVFDATMKTSSIFMSARLVPTITVNPIHKFACGTELRTGGTPRFGFCELEWNPGSTRQGTTSSRRNDLVNLVFASDLSGFCHMHCCQSRI